MKFMGYPRISQFSSQHPCHEHGMPWLGSQPRNQVILNEIFHGFPHFHQISASIFLKIFTGHGDFLLHPFPVLVILYNVCNWKSFSK
jgi:hypothetical protein